MVATEAEVLSDLPVLVGVLRGVAAARRMRDRLVRLRKDDDADEDVEARQRGIICAGEARQLGEVGGE